MPRQRKTKRTPYDGTVLGGRSVRPYTPACAECARELVSPRQLTTHDTDQRGPGRPAIARHGIAHAEPIARAARELNPVSDRVSEPSGSCPRSTAPLRRTSPPVLWDSPAACRYSFTYIPPCMHRFTSASTSLRLVQCPYRRTIQASPKKEGMATRGVRWPLHRRRLLGRGCRRGKRDSAGDTIRRDGRRQVVDGRG